MKRRSLRVRSASKSSCRVAGAGRVGHGCAYFGPPDKFPFAPGRGYTPPPAPAENYVALLDRLGLARGVIVQGNAHGYDNRVVLDALARYPNRFRGVAITDTRVEPGRA